MGFVNVEVPSFRLHVDTADAEPPRCLKIELVLDGEVLDAEDPIFLHDLAASLERGGRYYIWTCDCGDPGCAGRYEGVVVRHEGADYVTWHDRDLGHKLRMPLEPLRTSLNEVIVEAERLLRTGVFEWTPDLNAAAAEAWIAQMDWPEANGRRHHK